MKSLLKTNLVWLAVALVPLLAGACGGVEERRIWVITSEDLCEAINTVSDLWQADCVDITEGRGKGFFGVVRKGTTEFVTTEEAVDYGWVRAPSIHD